MYTGRQDDNDLKWASHRHVSDSVTVASDIHVLHNGDRHIAVRRCNDRYGPDRPGALTTMEGSYTDQCRIKAQVQ